MLQDEGIYLGRLMEKGVDAVGEKDTPRLFLIYEITHVARNGDWEDVRQTFRRTVSFWLSDKAYSQSLENLEAMGWNGEFREPEFTNPNVNENVNLECTHEEYQGKPQERWSLLDYQGEYQRKKVSNDVMELLEAKRDTEKLNSFAPPRAPAPASVPAADDIPF